jgi:type III restriction enzyme
MQLKLEELSYQRTAIQSVVQLFEGQERNVFDNTFHLGIRSNLCNLSPEAIAENVKLITEENTIDELTARLSSDMDFCIEMETGTGKTLVYLKTIYELYKHYGFTKFIILVPSVAIRQGILSTLKTFEHQLEIIYNIKPDYFDYDSKKLNRVVRFVEEQHPQIMIMTLASFNSDDKILNQTQRESLFSNMPFIEAIAQTNPIIIMDEPQEGMDTENSIKQIAKLNPLAKLRYSATHKVVKNLLYRLTPYDSYKQGLVKKIEVLTVAEKNDEATLKIELTEKKEDPKGKKLPEVKLKAWKLNAAGKFEFKETKWLKVGDNLGIETNNPSYNAYKIQRIYKSLTDGRIYKVEFANGTTIAENQTAKDLTALWRLQMEWLLRRHFDKTQKLNLQGIKCLSLIFIDRVANYMGENPVIKHIFQEKYKEIYTEFYKKEPTPIQIEACQGYYFAQSGKKEFTDDEQTMQKNKEIYKTILEEKQKLLSFDNPIQFIFSHSALGVGWDNPNIFNIATLNQTFSDIKKRQEIGRGLRISVNQGGHRMYDLPEVKEGQETNLLTIVPNETYESFVAQYQEQIKEVYGTTQAGSQLRNTHKGKPIGDKLFAKTKNTDLQDAFQRFWQKVARKTEYVVHFDENNLINEAARQLNTLTIPDYVIEVASRKITTITESKMDYAYQGSENYKGSALFAATDIVEEISENTQLSYPTVLTIINKLTNLTEIVKNPPRFIQEAIRIIKNVELDEMIRGIVYTATPHSYKFDFDDFNKTTDEANYVHTPHKGYFDKMLIDSQIEKDFATLADKDDDVLTFMKLPDYYLIPTPIGSYNPDFAIVFKPRRLKTPDNPEFYFVVETKGTNDLNDKKALKESEIYKIKCAIEHFKALGIDTQFRYEAPVKEYQTFKTRTQSLVTPVIQNSHE